jgi:glycosyltransferase involved in cell wall biosynthesis
MHTVMLLGPSLKAVSGVSTHLNQLFRSSLSKEFRLVHFQVGSQGRTESGFKKTWRLFSSPLLLLYRILTVRPEIIHVNTSMDAKGYWRDLIYVILGHCLRRKIVLQVHGGYLPQDFFPRGPCSKLLELVLRSVDIVIVLSQESFHAYRTFAPSVKLDVIPNAIELVADPASKQVPTDRESPLRLAYVGRLDESKGVFDILRAVFLLKQQEISVRLVIAGSGPDEARMRTIVDQCDLQDIVTFTGVVHEAERDLIWEQSDLFIFPTYREALPYSLLESMAARTPALVSCVGAIPDVIQNGVHGIFIPSKDPHSLAETIAILNGDRQAIHRMGEASRQRIAGFYTIGRLASDFGRTYLDILERDS